MLKLLYEFITNEYEFTVVNEERIMFRSIYTMDRCGRRIEVIKHPGFAKVGEKIKLKFDYFWREYY